MLQQLSQNNNFSLKLLAALGCGLIGGIFFAFSTFVMPALKRIQPSQGITAMQSINITVINPWFMTVFLGTAILCLFLIITSLSKWHSLSITYCLLGCLFYLVGTVLITVGFNVPLNETLAKLDPSSSAGETFWSIYLTRWTFWNHIRTAAALVAAALITIGLCDRVHPS